VAASAEAHAGNVASEPEKGAAWTEPISSGEEAPQKLVKQKLASAQHRRQAAS
jgi:hypothetical protein